MSHSKTASSVGFFQEHSNLGPAITLTTMCHGDSTANVQGQHTAAVRTPPDW